MKFYEKVDPKKKKDDVVRIINNRRPKGTPKGTRIPTQPWIGLCNKLQGKYNVNPLN